MALKLKGFVSIKELMDNDVSTVAALGELSTWSMTYAKGHSEYTHDVYSGYRLTTFKCVDSSDAVTTPTTINVAQIFLLIQQAINYSTLNGRSYDTDDLVTYLVAKLTNQVSNLKCGEIVDNGGIGIPGWFSWTTVDSDLIKIWVADSVFRAQYDEYSITVVPPITKLDDFFSAYSTIKAELAANDIVSIMERAQAAKDSYPETYIRTVSYNFTSQYPGAEAIAVSWVVLVYGAQGDSVDNIKDAIMEYILANSSKTAAEWKLIMPDIFKRTEFVVLPRWDKMSIENLKVQGGLYSSFTEPNEAIVFAKAQANFYTSSFVAANINVLPFPYKELTLLVVNGENNVTGKTSLSTLFKDYIPEPTASTDFNRMTVYTREWVLALQTAIIAAENADEFNSIDTGLRKVYRNNKLYISVVYDNVNFLVSAYQNYGV